MPTNLVRPHKMVERDLQYRPYRKIFIICISCSELSETNRCLITFTLD